MYMAPFRTFLVALLLICLHPACGLVGSSGLKVTGITCEYQQNPLMVATETPRFGWQVQAGKKHQGTLQSAYAIEVYTHLDDEEVTVWESGKVASGQSQRVLYDGEEALIPGRAYSWRVKVWDSNDRPSPWSERVISG